ncbi:MAG: hypothetical protein GEV03_27095 [Streptosporangiales bacterium]|nr:hypothetical protein [Streptosporangiales bacterium]
MIGCGADRRQERARRKCLEALLAALDGLGVSHVVMEPRGSRLDERDFTLVDACRRKRIISADLRVDFARPLDEGGCLWVVDAACGAVLADLRGNSSFLDTLRARLTVIEIDID